MHAFGQSLYSLFMLYHDMAIVHTWDGGDACLWPIIVQFVYVVSWYGYSTHTRRCWCMLSPIIVQFVYVVSWYGYSTHTRRCWCMLSPIIVQFVYVVSWYGYSTLMRRCWRMPLANHCTVCFYAHMYHRGGGEAFKKSYELPNFSISMRNAYLSMYG